MLLTTLFTHDRTLMERDDAHAIFERDSGVKNVVKARKKGDFCSLRGSIAVGF